MADQNINFNVGVKGSAQAEQAFARLANSQEKVATSGRGSSQAMIEFGRVIQDAPYGIMGVANNVTRLAELMGAGGPLLLGLSLATSALVVFFGRSRETKEEATKLSEEIKRLSQAFKGMTTFTPFMGDRSFTITKDNIDEVIHSLNRLITTSKVAAEAFSPNDPKKGLFSANANREEVGKMFATYNSLINSNQKQRVISNEVLDILKKQKAELEAQKLISEMLNGIGMVALNNEERKLAEQKAKVDKLLDGIAQRTNAINLKGLESITKSKFGTQDALFTSRNMSVTKPQTDILDLDTAQQSMADFMQTISTESAMTLRDAFGQAWQDIFGEANSLLEQFFANIASGLANMATQRVATGLFDWAIGGFGGNLFDLIGKAFGSKSMQGGGSITVVNQLGNEVVNKVVLNANNNNARLRYA